MKITVGQVKGFYNGLLKIEGKKLPLTISYAIIRNMDILKKEIDRYELTRIQRCRQLARKDEQGNPIQKDGNYDIPENEKSGFLQEMADLAAVEITADLQMISLSDLKLLESDSRYDLLSVKELKTIEFMTAEEGE